MFRCCFVPRGALIGPPDSLQGGAHVPTPLFGLLQELGIEVDRFYKYFDQKLYKGMGLKRATFFDKERFGVDRFLPGFGTHYLGLTYPPEILGQIPISEVARKDLARLQEATVDYPPGLSTEEKRRKLRKTSYKDQTNSLKTRDCLSWSFIYFRRPKALKDS